MQPTFVSLEKQKVNGLYLFPDSDGIHHLFVFQQNQIQWLKVKDCQVLESQIVVLPEQFWVVDLLFDPKEKILLCGSRTGDLAVYEIEKQLSPRLISNLHGSDAVTSIVLEVQKDGYLVHTVGRDGMYTVSQLRHEISQNEAELTIQVSHRTRITKGWLERIVPSQGTILLLGFFDKQFFVYNQSKGYEMFSVACGGGHRFWDICIPHPSLSGTVFAFHRLRKVWYFIKQSGEKEQNPVVLEPYHSMETRSVAFLQMPGVENVIVSGGEEGMLSFHSSHPNQSLKRLGFCRKHSGSIRAISCPPGSILFTGGASQELKAWKVFPEQDSSIRSVELHSAPHWSPTIETRIMDLDAIPTVNGYWVATANSDSWIQLWRYTNQFELIDQTQYHQKCVLKSRLLICGQQIYWFTAATDGRICMWDITDHRIQLAHEFRVHQSGIKALHVHVHVDKHVYILSGGDDNALHLIVLDVQTMQFEKYQLKNAHGSSIVGVFMNQQKLYSASIDQRLNEYEFDGNQIVYLRSRFIEVPDCSDMAIRDQIVVVGHGIHVYDTL
jgi:WD40 repeat protein